MKAISSGLKTNDAAIFAGPCWYLGASVGAAAVIWNSENTTTTDDTEIDTFAAAGFHSLKEPVWCSKGISGIITGNFIVWYAM